MKWMKEEKIELRALNMSLTELGCLDARIESFSGRLSLTSVVFTDNFLTEIKAEDYTKDEVCHADFMVSPFKMRRVNLERSFFEDDSS
jgi:hypothetical protein